MMRKTTVAVLLAVGLAFGVNRVALADADLTTMTPSQALHRLADQLPNDQRPMAIAVGAVSGLVLVNMASCGVLTGMLVGGFLGDYVYGRLNPESQTVVR